jgi:ABC-type lipoprotein export system ATPase subunit
MQLTIRDLLPVYFDASRKEASEVWGKELQFDRGELVKIVAPSGSGKTSLVHFLYGMRHDYSGDVLFDGKPTAKFGAADFARERSSRVSVVFQDLRLFPEQTVRENLEIKRQLNPFHNAEAIPDMAERLGIGDRLDRKTKICSYGEQQRVAIIRALLQPYELLLLDEPFSHLDHANSRLAMDLMLEETAKRNATIIFADLERVDFYPHTKLYHL